MHFLQETVEAKYVLLYLVIFIVPALYFVIVMVSLIFWAVERGRPYIPNEMFPDRHIYYPIRHTKKVKVMFIIDGIGVLCVMFPLFIALCASTMADADPWIVGGISAAVGLLILFGLTRIPWGSDVECVITDMQGLTIKRTEKMEKYSISMYQGYTNGGKSNPFKLIFRNIDGSENYVYLPFLAAGDPINVGKDLNEVRNKGHLYQFPNPVYGNPVQNIPIAKANPSQVNPPPVDNGKAEAFLAMNEQNKLIADKERYRPYLENVLSRIPYNKKDEFIRRNLKGENIVIDRHLVSNYYWNGSIDSDPVFKALIETSGTPDLTILLYATPKTRMERLAKRDKNDPDLSDPEKKDDGYAKMLGFLQNFNMPYLVIDTDQLSLDEVKEIVDQEIKNLKGYSKKMVR